MNIQEPTSFGVYKPVGHLVISFPDQQSADAAYQALGELGLATGELIHRYTDRQMLQQIEQDLQRASALASVGQEMNLVKAHRDLAQRGHHWLVVRVHDDEQASVIVSCVRPFHAQTAQHYGRFVIEELIEHRGDLPQVGESPDRGLDTRRPDSTTSTAPG